VDDCEPGTVTIAYEMTDKQADVARRILNECGQDAVFIRTVPDPMLGTLDTHVEVIVINDTPEGGVTGTRIAPDGEALPFLIRDFEKGTTP
jgi:hypothetical protein